VVLDPIPDPDLHLAILDPVHAIPVTDEVPEIDPMVPIPKTKILATDVLVKAIMPMNVLPQTNQSKIGRKKNMLSFQSPSSIRKLITRVPRSSQRTTRNPEKKLSDK